MGGSGVGVEGSPRREQGRPWDTGKNFEQASPLGLIHPASDVGHVSSGSIQLKVNGEIKQNADVRELIWPVEDVIAYASKLYCLQPGDLIYTGTPAGVGPVVEGDEIVVSIAGLSDTAIRVGAKVAG